MALFQGHQTFALILDVLLAIVTIPSVMTIHPHVGRKMTFKDFLVLNYLIMLIPNAMYACFEIRHLLFIDNIADNPNTMSYLVFGSISLLGLFCAVGACRYILATYPKSQSERFYYMFVLSLINGFGATAGLLDFYSAPAYIFPPYALLALWKILCQPNLILLATVTTILFFLFNLLIDLFSKPSS
jgi:hypothetical protein